MMKKLTFLALFTFLSATSFAQQALFGGQNVISPEVHPDNTVTFRFMAPKAVKVQVTGDFLPTQKTETPFGMADVPGAVDLKEGKEGIWEYTTPNPLPSELYSYSFIVDGLKNTDPNNVYLNRDVASVTNIFITKGGQGDYYSVNKVPHGTVARRWYDSPTLGISRRVTIYTPAGYETSGKKYPVFYLLHGMGGDEEAWIALGRTAQIMDNLIAQGKAEPMIVVKIQMAELGTFGISISSEGAESIDKFTAKNIKAVNILFAPGTDFENLINRAEFNLVASRAAQVATLKAEKAGDDTVDLAAAKNKGTSTEPAPEEPTDPDNTPTGGSDNTGGSEDSGTDTGGSENPDSEGPAFS